MRSAECKKLQCYKCVTAQCVLLKKHPNVVQIENTQLGSHVHRWDWMNECPSWSSTSNNVCAMKCARICSISFNCKITIKWNIHNCFQNPLFFDILFFASLRMNCFCSFYGGAFFFFIFHRALNAWLIFNGHIKKNSMFWHARYTWLIENLFKYLKKEPNWKCTSEEVKSVFISIYTEIKLTVMIIPQLIRNSFT